MAKEIKTIFRSAGHTLAIIAAALLFWNPLAGLDPDKPVDGYLLDQWTISEGIPSNSIFAITQTPDGYLWIATSKGLVRFDGIKFSLLDFAGDKTGGPLKNTIPDTLFVNKEGVLWIGSPLGLTSYRYQTGRFTTLTPADGLTKDRIRRINDDMRGNLWISFFSSYVNRFANGTFTPFTASHGLEGKKINAIVEDQNGNLLFGSRENGVFIYKEGKFFPYPIQGLDNLNIITMHEDARGELWIGTNNGLLRLTDRETRKFTLQEGLSSNYITYITGDSDRNLWVGSLKGLNRIRTRENSTAAIEILLNGVTVTCLFEDREKSLWVGTYSSGLKRLKEGKFMSYAPLEVYQEEFLLAVFEDGQGNTWIGSLSGKLFRCRGSELIETVQPPDLSGTGILAIAEDAEGNLLLGTNGKGVFQKKNRAFAPLTPRENLADNVVSSITRDSQGNLWLCTFDGVSVLRYPNGAIESFNSQNGLLGNRVHNVYEDKAKNIWIAADKGITVLKEGKISKESTRNYLPGDSVTCIVEDRSAPGPGGSGQPIYWIATHGAGLKRLALKDNTVVSYTTADGMLTNFIYQFFEDQRENFWLMSNSGILRLDKTELNRFALGRLKAINCMSFGISDGMKSFEFNNEYSRHSALNTGNGEFRFITKNGISIVNPAKVRIDKSPPPVVIEDAFFNERAIPLHQERNAWKGITVVRFHFTAPTFLSPGKIKFKYRLEGFDPAWVSLSPGSERTALYKNLEPGTYTFKVIACNAEGIWNRTGDSMTFTLIPFFYQTLVFKFIILLMLMALGAAGLYLYKKRPFKKQDRYKSSPLTPQYAEECLKKLTRLMEKDNVYSSADISLPSLAEKLSISPHLLSQLLNERLNQNFSDFINSYRIEDAKRIFQGPGGARKKIAAVAFDVGFNTLVAFYNAFKKYTGMTPAQYKKEAGKKK